MYRGGVVANLRKRHSVEHHHHDKHHHEKHPHDSGTLVKIFKKVKLYCSWVFTKYIEHPELKDWAPNNKVGQQYAKLAKKAEMIATSNSFNGFIIACICIAGILVGLQTYESMDGHIVTTTLDNIILGIFGCEVILKIVAEGYRPWLYFMNKEWRWNNFDFWIVMLCLPIFNIGGDGSSNSVALLRLLRLMRVIKIVKKVPQLQMIVMGLVGGLSSIGYILLLLFLVFYLYAIGGYYLFAQNDPWHYRNILIAFVTLFRACTFEDWTDLFYVNYYGCDEYLNVYIVDEEQWTDDNQEYWCTAPKRRNLAGFPYWVSFIIIAGLVMLALFIGAVTMSMQASMHELKVEKEAAQNEKKEARMRKKLMEQGSQNSISGLGNSAGSLFSRSPSPSEQHISSLVTKIKTLQKFKAFSHSNSPPKIEPVLQHSPTKLTRGFTFGKVQQPFDPHARVTNIKALLRWKDWQEDSIMKEMLVACWEGNYVDPNHLDALKVIPEMPWPIEKYYALSLVCDKVATDPRFVNMITIVIICAGILVGVQTFELDDTGLRVCNVFDGLILSIFTFEVALKIVAENFRPHRFFRTGWNVFDFIIVVGSFLPSGVESMLVILRLLRLLRVLKLVKSLPQLAMIVNAMIMGMSSIGFIGVILLLVYYLFAIVGMLMFATNDPWHFGKLHWAMLTLFRCSTLEDWSDVMYINFLGCHRYGYDDLPGCDYDNPSYAGWWAVLYFVIFTVITALVLLTLFIGVICTSMDEVQQDQDREKDVEERLDKYAAEEGIVPKQLELYKRVFDLLDIDGGGTIEDEELALGLTNAGVSVSAESISQTISNTLGQDHIELDFANFVNLVHVRQKDQSDNPKKDSDEVKDEKLNAEVSLLTSPAMSNRFLAIAKRAKADFGNEKSPPGSRKNIAITENNAVIISSPQSRLISSARSNSVDSSRSAGSDAPLLTGFGSQQSSRNGRGVADKALEIVARSESPDSNTSEHQMDKDGLLHLGTLSDSASPRSNQHDPKRKISPQNTIRRISSPYSGNLMDKKSPPTSARALSALKKQTPTKLKAISGHHPPHIFPLQPAGDSPARIPKSDVMFISPGTLVTNNKNTRILHPNPKTKKTTKKYDESNISEPTHYQLHNRFGPPSPSLPTDEGLSEETLSSNPPEERGSLKSNSEHSHSHSGSPHSRKYSFC